MINVEIEKSLKELHQELEKLAPAIEHIELLRNVIVTVQSIPNKHIELIESLKSVDSEFKKETLEHIKQEMAQLIQSNSKLIEEMGLISSSNESVVNSLKNYSIKIEEYLSNIASVDFPARLSSIEADISSSSSALNNLQGSINNIQSEQNRNTDKIITKTEKVHDAINSISESLKNELSDLKQELKNTKIISFALIGLMIIALGFIIFK